MKKRKNQKRFYKLIKEILPFLSILSIFSLILTIMTIINTQHTLSVTESFRDALSKSSEITSKGGIAYPIRKGEKWGVSFQQESGVRATAQISSTITFIKGNTTILVLTSD